MEVLKTCSNNGSIQHDLQSSADFNAPQPYTFSDDIDSGASTPYVSAPSTPLRGPPHSYGGGFFYSAPSSPTHTHHVYSNMDSVSSNSLEESGGSFEFEFTVRQETSGPAPSGSMSSADELFLNGQIRPMMLSSHLQRPQDIAPLIDVLENNGENGGDEEVMHRSKKPLRRRARSMSLLRTNSAFQWLEEFQDGRESTEIKEELELELELEMEAEEKQRAEEDNEIPSSGASSRSSSVGRSSKRWVFLKELLYRSKSEGRNRNHKLWSALSFTPSSSSGKKDKKSSKAEDGNSNSTAPAEGPPPKTTTKKAVNGVGMDSKRSMGRSAHELHYTINRAQAEEMRKKTYLPYRQGLLGCIGFSSKSYGAMNGFAKAFNPVPSR